VPAAPPIAPSALGRTSRPANSCRTASASSFRTKALRPAWTGEFVNLRDEIVVQLDMHSHV